MNQNKFTCYCATPIIQSCVKFKQLQEALLYKYLYFDTKTVGDLKNAANFCAVFIIY